MIRTPRLVLRPFTLADTAKTFAMSREEGLGRWMPDQVYRDEAHAEEVLRALIDHASALTPRARPVVLGVEHDGVLVGHVGLSAARNSVEIGYAIEDAQCGKGPATEAVDAMARWGLSDLGLDEILGIVDAENASSRRVLEKAGFTRITDEARPGRTLVIYRRTR